MANKQTIQQALARQRLLILRMARYANELKELNNKIEKMRSGKIRVPPPPGIKVKIGSNPNGICADEFGDLIPSFGPK
jgi:hypothetical protein